ncbi:Chaperone protein DnaJ-like protein [Drosera capensis]
MALALPAAADLDLRRPTLLLLHHHHRRRVLLGCSISSIHRRLSTGADSDPPPPEFDEVENAYEILGVFEGCSCEEIKAAFRRLAKETHPDVVEKGCDEGSSSRFVRIVAAYEVVVWFQLIGILVRGVGFVCCVDD